MYLGKYKGDEKGLDIISLISQMKRLRLPFQEFTIDTQTVDTSQEIDLSYGLELCRRHSYSTRSKMTSTTSDNSGVIMKSKNVMKRQYYLNSRCLLLYIHQNLHLKERKNNQFGFPTEAVVQRTVS